MRTSIIVLITLLSCLKGKSQSFTQPELEAAKDKFHKDAAIITLSSNIDHSQHLTIADTDPQSGLALILSPTRAMLFSQHHKKFIHEWPNNGGGNWQLAPGANRVAIGRDNGIDILDREKQIAFLPKLMLIDILDDNRILVKDQKNRMAVWDVATNKEVIKLPKELRNPRLSPDRTKILADDDSGQPYKTYKSYVVDLVKGEKIFKIKDDNVVWINNRLIHYPNVTMDIITNAEVKLTELEEHGKYISLNPLTGEGIFVFQEGNEIHLYDGNNRKWLTEKPLFLPKVTNPEYAIFSNPPAVLAIGNNQEYSFWVHDNLAKSSAVLITPGVGTEPLLWHERRQPIKLSEAEKTRAIAWAKQREKEKKESEQLALVKYKTKQCADKFLPLVERRIDSGDIVSYRGDLYFFRRADCDANEIVLHGKGNQMSWGLSTKRVQPLYADEIYKSTDHMHICDRCDGSGTLTFTGGKVYKQELPSFYKPGYTVTRYYQSEQKSYEMCPKCKGAGIQQ